MKGVIKTYLPEKKYGFIKGDDGKDYFFHESGFTDKNHISKLCEEALVNFEQQATPKGYKANKCSLLSSSDVLTFVTPDEFIASRGNRVRNWDIIEQGNWIVFGSSRNSPDSAKRDVINSAKRISANALVDLEYFKTTGSESGSGKGTHYYTIHNFRARPVTLAKRNSKGRMRLDDLTGLNQKAQIVKDNLISKNKKRRNIIWIIGVILSIFCLPVDFRFMAIPILSGLLLPVCLTDYDWWLTKA